MDPARPDPAAAPAHPAPAADERPRSRFAVVVLVLSVVLGVVALGGLWVAVLPALILCAWGLVRIRPQRVRGQGLVIVAIVIALVLGFISFGFTKKARNAARHLATGVMTALATTPGPTEADDPLDAWLAVEARTKGASATIRERFGAVVERVGPYAGEVTLRSTLLGATAVMSPPPDARDVTAPEGEDGDPPAIALWAEAAFRDATLHVALVIGEGDPEDMAQAIVRAAGAEPVPVVSDVRFFRVE